MDPTQDARFQEFRDALAKMEAPRSQQQPASPVRHHPVSVRSDTSAPPPREAADPTTPRRVSSARSLPGPAPPSRFRRVASFVNTPVVLALLTFCVILVVLAVAKPSMCAVEIDDGSGAPVKRKLNMRLALIFSGMCAGVVLIVPYIIRWRTQKAIAEHQQAAGTN